jgi:DNA-binding response OmpR family regulator
VHAVSTARELRELLPHGPWALVCADVELPDGRGPELLRETSLLLGGTGALVALVRDAADEMVARGAGVSTTLRKPFEGEALDRVLKTVVPARGVAGTP